jgi:hypothetical protein
MLIAQDYIEKLQRELEEARARLLAEDGERYRIVMRDISPEERSRILDNLTDRKERQLFGLEPPDEPKSTRGERSGKSGGTLECPICHKAGLTELGLKLHTARMHKGEKTPLPV